MHPQDRNTWFFLYFVVLSVFLLAAFDPGQRPAVIDLVKMTIIPLACRELVANIKPQ
jgi:hypothetical protein